MQPKSNLTSRYRLLLLFHNTTLFILNKDAWQFRDLKNEDKRLKVSLLGFQIHTDSHFGRSYNSKSCFLPDPHTQIGLLSQIAYLLL